MSDTDFWSCPPDSGVWGSGDHTITLVLPPFSGPGPVFAAHDPLRAQEFAEAFGTVDEVLEEVQSASAAEPMALETRKDLDFIRVGCWGNVLAISDPSLADNGNAHPVLGQVTALRDRFPGARIVGSAHVDCGETHSEDVIVVPGVPLLHSEGWPGEEPWTLTGDLQAVLDALGITPEVLEEEDVELSGDPRYSDWEGLARLALGPYDPWGRADLLTSVFRVRHTESATALMEEIWLPDV
ncbi:hypothetical protein HEK616_67160 [Streptomyces nigrescens]|uniref:Uncharacterized protein n=1 Tax=Streptomyces nigrescens TaxID=1920 RepID=A0ABN6R489_STRNI|nr:DUF6333 family protein [Streptomyces nigrescens]BDM73229.1 hypothetical protein HEK616_67160 [Streptomyces nigrescens]